MYYKSKFLNQMISFIGKILFKLDSYKVRFINRYKLSLLGAHGVNCHIGGEYFKS